MSWHEGCAAAASAGAHLSGMACMSGRAPWCRVRAASGAHRTAPMPAHRWSHRRPHGLKRLPPPACVSCTLPSPQCKTSFPMAKQSNANPAFLLSGAAVEGQEGRSCFASTYVTCAPFIAQSAAFRLPGLRGVWRFLQRGRVQLAHVRASALRPPCAERCTRRSGVRPACTRAIAPPCRRCRRLALPPLSPSQQYPLCHADSS